MNATTLTAAQQFTLVNHYLGIRIAAGVKPFQQDAGFFQRVLDGYEVSQDRLNAAIADMQKDKAI